MKINMSLNSFYVYPNDTFLEVAGTLVTGLKMFVKIAAKCVFFVRFESNVVRSLPVEEIKNFLQKDCICQYN